MNKNFNSIKVRLELTIFDNGMKPQDYFQFHKGAIRTYCAIPFFVTYKNFNSIKVRLELSQLAIYHIKHSKFQFHKGAIRTNGSCRFKVADD